MTQVNFSWPERSFDNSIIDDVTIAQFYSKKLKKNLRVGASLFISSCETSIKEIEPMGLSFFPLPKEDNNSYPIEMLKL